MEVTPNSEFKHSPATQDLTVIYVGDPMCSWCWGIAPQLAEFEQYLNQHGIPLEIWVGGLRPGGGQPWDKQLKDFLRHHWQQVNEVSGQPFNYDLLQTEDFNYDTEPACRMVVAGRKWSGKENLKWFAQVQHSFYVKNLDLTRADQRLHVLEHWVADIDQFEEHFQSQEVRQTTQQEFAQTRAWGVNSYPTVVLQTPRELIGLAQGYCTLCKRLQAYLLSENSR